MKTAANLLLAGMLIFQGAILTEGKKIDLLQYENELQTESVAVCSASATKTYMDYRRINDSTSAQAIYIDENMHVDETTGLLYDEDGFIGVALGSYFGEIGTRFYFTLDTGTVLPLVKIEEKSDQHTINGCAHQKDNSVIEMVIDTQVVKEYYKDKSTNVIYTGNFNDDERFNGKIVSIEVVQKNLGNKKRLKLGAS